MFCRVCLKILLLLLSYNHEYFGKRKPHLANGVTLEGCDVVESDDNDDDDDNGSDTESEVDDEVPGREDDVDKAGEEEEAVKPISCSTIGIFQIVGLEGGIVGAFSPSPGIGTFAGTLKAWDIGDEGEGEKGASVLSVSKSGAAKAGSLYLFVGAEWDGEEAE